MKTLAPTQLVISLNAVMGYKNPGLVARLQEKLNLSKEEAELLFDDTKRFLYLGASTRKNLVPPEMIDEGWHNFLLFTREYQKFCQKFFGFFIHHNPKDPTKPRTVKTRAAREKMVNTTKALAASTFGKNLSSFWQLSLTDTCSSSWLEPV